MSGKDIYDLKFNAENYGDVLCEASLTDICNICPQTPQYLFGLRHSEAKVKESEAHSSSAVNLQVGFRFGFNEREF